MNKIYKAFPGGKHKVLTFSYDDGKLEDRRLVEIFNKNGLRGTFNLNTGIDQPDIRIRCLYPPHRLLIFSQSGDKIVLFYRQITGFALYCMKFTVFKER